MAYVVQRVGKALRWAYHSGFGYDAQRCTYFGRSAESKRKANKKKYHSGFGGCETRVR